MVAMAQKLAPEKNEFQTTGNNKMHKQRKRGKWKAELKPRDLSATESDLNMEPFSYPSVSGTIQLLFEETTSLRFFPR
ncbi:hypothetical protein V6N13_146352 [Hibiscus sabdariffa]